MKRILIILSLLACLISCREIQPEFPDEPRVDYQSFSYYVVEDLLGNLVLTGRMAFRFTDGDGNLGLPPLSENTDTSLADSLKYNFYLQLYDLDGFEFIKIPEDEGGVLKYRIPSLDKHPTSGLMELDISYPIIVHDTIFYTFYIVDRAFNRSNVDTTDIQVLSNITFGEEQGE